MSALAFLSGLASGAGDEISKINEQQRQFKQQNNVLLADTINKRLATENLDWPTYQSLRQQEYKLRGVDDKTTQQLLGHEKQVFDAHQAQVRQGVPPDRTVPPGLEHLAPQIQGQPQANPPSKASVPPALAPSGPSFAQGGPVLPDMPQPGQSTNNGQAPAVQTPSTPPAQPTPAVQTPATPQASSQPVAQLGPLPQAPPGFVGTGTFRAQDAAQAQTIMDEAQLHRMRELMSLYDAQDKVQATQNPANGTVESGDEGPHYKVVRGLSPTGITENRSYDAGIRSPRPVYGEDIVKQYPQFNGDPNKWYSSVNYAADGVRFRPTTPPTHPSIVPSEDSPTGAAQVELDPKGNIVGVATGPDGKPLGVKSPWAKTERQSTKLIHYTDNNGQIQWKVVPTDTTTTPQQPGSPLGQVPTPAGVATTKPQAPATSLPAAPRNSLGNPKVAAAPLGSNNATPIPGTPFDPKNLFDFKAWLSGIDSKMGDDVKIPKGRQIDYETRRAELGIIPNEVDAAERSRSLMAQSLIPHMEQVYNLVHEAEDKGELGVLKTRWNQLLTGKVGNDPTPDHIYSRLATNLAFLGSATAMVHGGLRGGSSPGMIEHWDQAIRAADPETMLSELGQVYEWMKGYQNIARGSARTMTGQTVGPSLLPNGPLGQVPVNQQINGVPQVGGSYAGGKVLKVEKVQ